MPTPPRVVIPHTDLSVTPICLGTGDFGSKLCGPALAAVFDRYVALGGNFFDTAHCYAFWFDQGRGLGISERTLGELIRSRGLSGQVIVATKGGHPANLPHYPRPDRYLSPEVIAGDISDSLERLGVERLDLFLLHRDDPRVPAGEIVQTLHEEVKRGRVRYVGGSNWTGARLAAANEYAKKYGLTALTISQPSWNLAQRNPGTIPDPTMRALTAEDKAWHVQTGLPLMCYNGSAGGYFSSGGKKGAGAYGNPVSQGRLARCQELAQKKGCTPGQIALAWLRHQPFCVLPIISSSTPEHVAEALGAGTVRLTVEETRWLREGPPPP